ncbi:imidazole glycerol phosphate synthase subunit HisH [Magnetococcus sp. PR-3]|uniref:imidazole glycerol phosphate synthase subunit HisH n=1 Tax=Magnetococcus sp. PR-3 TaxID=3120355 RepID=UPI002FCE126F
MNINKSHHTVIIDYDCGNILSVYNMARRFNRQVSISSKPAEIASADALILPGVGSFDYGITQLETSGIRDVLERRVIEENIPILGICLGMQLLGRCSDEGSRDGFGWIDADTRAFDKSKMAAHERIPHIGWCDVFETGSSELFVGLEDGMRFYFVHSYHMICDHHEDVILTANHSYPFVAGVRHKQITGLQCHPEKSHRFGMTFMKNWFQELSEHA